MTNFSFEFFLFDVFLGLNSYEIFRHGDISRGSTPYNGLYGEATPERGTIFTLQVYERVGISRVEVYERVGKSVI